MRTVPSQVFDEIRDRLWAQADEDDWITLSNVEKSKFYVQWVEHEGVGGVLSRYMDEKKVRLYIKDTVMKPYVRERTKNPLVIFKKLGLPDDQFFVTKSEKPHTILLHDGRLMCWGPADNWKDVIMAVYERARREGNKPFAAVLMWPAGPTNQAAERALIADYAQRLGLERLVWLED
ncbi:MAG: hypothetical protein QOH88_1793 [Verrucomicrobiota bacterium]|jgi:hypothetical protein